MGTVYTHHVTAHREAVGAAFGVRLMEAGSEVLENLSSFLLLVLAVLEVDLACIDKKRGLGGSYIFLLHIR